MIRREVSAKKWWKKMALLCKGTDSCTEVKRCSLRIRVEYLCSMLPITLAQFHTKIFDLAHPILDFNGCPQETNDSKLK